MKRGVGYRTVTADALGKLGGRLTGLILGVVRLRMECMYMVRQKTLTKRGAGQYMYLEYNSCSVYATEFFH